MELSYASRAAGSAAIRASCARRPGHSPPLPVAAQVGGRAQRPKIIRPDGPVWNVIRTNCTNCHGIDDRSNAALRIVDPGVDDLTVVGTRGHPGTGFPFQ